MKPLLPQPTRAELAILRVLWKEGRCTVRHVHERLREEQDEEAAFMERRLGLAWH